MQLYQKRRLQHRYFPVNFAKFLGTLFFKEHFWLLLLLFDARIFLMSTQSIYLGRENTVARTPFQFFLRSETYHILFCEHSPFCNHCVKTNTELFWSVFSPNAGKYGSEKTYSDTFHPVTVFLTLFFEKFYFNRDYLYCCCQIYADVTIFMYAYYPCNEL